LHLIPRALLASAVFLAACGPSARIPPRPAVVPGPAPSAADVRLARSLAPTLFLQRDEPFVLSRVVAVIHPIRRVVAYHLLWRDDAHGAWLPLTIPTDEEIVWVGFDSSAAPTQVWTYWHGAILHSPWPRSQVLVDVQWGKHGSLPRGYPVSRLPALRTLNAFYAYAWLLPDFWLGNVNRPGPWCFCRGYRRFRDFSRPLVLTDSLDAVVTAVDPRPALRAVFGSPYSEKPWWPWGTGSEVKGGT
jgi:hypothetical protein